MLKMSENCGYPLSLLPKREVNLGVSTALLVQVMTAEPPVCPVTTCKYPQTQFVNFLCVFNKSIMSNTLSTP